VHTPFPESGWKGQELNLVGAILPVAFCPCLMTSPMISGDKQYPHCWLENCTSDLAGKAAEMPLAASMAIVKIFISYSTMR
jgi:hypothetical protein